MDHPDLFWGLVVSFLFGNFFLLVSVVMMICVGVYGISNSLTDVLATLAFSIIGYVLRLFRFDPAPMLIGFVLGPMMEEFFRHACCCRGEIR